MGTTERSDYDLIVIGGGPAGATAALRAARRGLRTVVLEREPHPRFHVGESFLPRNKILLRDLGLDDKVAALPQTRKLGASFALGHDAPPTDFWFEHGLIEALPEAFNVERAPFDRLLLDCAREAGARVREGVSVSRAPKLEDGDVAVEVRGAGPSTIRAKYVIDASGQATVLGRQLKTRRTLPDLRKVAYFGHFTGVERREDERAGFPLVVMCREGWFWFIPIDDRRTSIGLVMDAGAAARVGVPARQMLAWGLARSPLTRKLVERATGPAENQVTADFSYSCRPYAGAGYFLVGDAATFVDPIFSTGVCLGMMSACKAVDAVGETLDGRIRPRKGRRDYCRYVEDSSSVFFRLVRRYYGHSFRELLLHGHGPLKMHSAVISVLCGHVFPRPGLALRWRLRLFERFVELQRFLPVVPRREPFSLVPETRDQGLRASISTLP